VGGTVFSAGALSPGFETLFDPFKSLTGGGETNGSPANTATGTKDAGPGAGGRGITTGSGRPGVLGGGGGAATAAAVTAIGAVIGGGGGGASTNTTGPAISGAGGGGLVAIQRVG
jgi:hypothetical protein